MILNALVYRILISMTLVSLGVSKPWDMEFKKLVVENISDPTLYGEVDKGEDNSSNKDVVAKNTCWTNYDPMELTSIKTKGVCELYFFGNGSGASMVKWRKKNASVY